MCNIPRFSKNIKTIRKKAHKEITTEMGLVRGETAGYGSNAVRDNIVDMMLSCRGVLPVIPLVALP